MDNSMRRIFVILFIIYFIVACAPSEDIASATVTQIPEVEATTPPVQKEISSKKGPTLEIARTQTRIERSSTEILIERDFDLFLLDTTNGNLTNITNSSAFELRAMWSPDGSKIAFMSDVGGEFHVEIININNLDDQNIIIPTTYNPYWSPDSKMLVVQSKADLETTATDISLVNADGTGLTNITNTPLLNEGDCVWSPTGEHIIFARNEGGEEDRKSQYAMEINGEILHKLQDDYGLGQGYFDRDMMSNYCESKAILPYRWYLSGHIYLLDDRNLEISEISHIFPPDSIADTSMAPILSPDCSKVTFTWNQDSIFNIYSIDLDGTHLAQLTYSNDTSMQYTKPIWSPDGTQIAGYTWDGVDNVGLYVMNADGSELRIVYGPYSISDDPYGRLIPFDFQWRP
jgi:Tol biopolymer transport system component